MAKMLEALDLQPGHRVLEVGLGTGYNAALLKTLVGPTGRVVSIDNQPDCVLDATARLDGYGVETAVADGYKGWPESAPYDRIIATASVAGCPRNWWQQLAPEGLLVLPMRFPDGLAAQAVATLRRTTGGFQSLAVTGGGFMPLRREGDPANAALPRTITAYDGTGAASRQLLGLSGPAIEQLSAAARTRLLALALGPPATTTRTTPGALGALWHLQLSVPASRLVLAAGEAVGRMAVGVTNRGGRGLALLAPFLNGGRTGMRSLSWGSADCAEQLRRHLLSWVQLGRPDINRLDITITYADGGDVTPRRGGKTLRLADQSVRVGWNH
jgi:protein-L-isoaspartate(D-aspartate) O-methyltransferase